MMKIKKTIFVLIAVLMIFLSAIPASALRCGCALVSIGDPTFTVLKKCGTPIYRELIRHGIKSSKRNILVYEIGSHYYYLFFKDGKLFKIESHRK